MPQPMLTAESAASVDRAGDRPLAGARGRPSAGPHVAALVPLSRTSGVPLHRQLYEGFRRAILDGLIRSGQRVPSTRALAVELGISRFPVLTAYEQLLHEGYFEGRVGAGTYVAAVLPDAAFRPAPLAPRPLRPGPAPPPAPIVARGDGGLRPFRTSLPALDAFPHALWARLVARHARSLSPAHMAYGDPAGLVPLRAAIAEHLRTARAVRCEADQVIVVSGSQAALRVAAAALLEPGDLVAIEEPGYPGAQAALRAAGARLVPVPVDRDGLDVEALERLGDGVRAAYVTPSHQYPLGGCLTARRRLALLDWAERHDAWVLEDDYDSEYRYVSLPLGSLQGTDPHGRVLYVGTFSKVLFPAIRLGYLVIPPALHPAMLAAREALDLFSPTLYQLALADFLREGHFARHLRRMRNIYLGRRQALLDGLARHCAGLLDVLDAGAGLHASTALAEAVTADDVTVVHRMASRSLTATALSSCYLGGPVRRGLLLGFGGSNEARLVQATRVLGDVLREAR